MSIPFPIFIQQLVMQTSAWGMDELLGLIILYIAFNLSDIIFIYIGYIRAIPECNGGNHHKSWCME
ncbi:hypothetical protein [Cytobacillus oceanisediminis]|uniref:hypothetical protein n=1 Tax=Cytobacillus oceanisediminis TaxID=665099 RepID=UPI00047534FC|nr:hypothetical protein [Cytobacillus oceanisediminis]